MKISKISFIFILVILSQLPFSILIAKEDSTSFYINLTSHNYGLSFGNSKRINGLRINLQDRNAELVNGINVTLWKNDSNPNFIINGCSLGLIDTYSNMMNGLAIGGLVRNEIQYGISVGILAVNSKTKVTGIGIGGLGVFAGENTVNNLWSKIGECNGGNLSWLMIGGLGVFAGNNLKGLMIGGLGVGCGNDLNGCAISTLAIAAVRDMKGIFLTGIGGWCGNNMTGLLFSGFAGVVTNDMTGVLLSGIVAASKRTNGLMIAPGSIDITDSIRGLGISSYTKANKFEGIGLGGCIRSNNFNGLSIGILNITNKLNGVQIGIINYAANNPWPFKVLPILNLHID